MCEHCQHDKGPSPEEHRALYRKDDDVESYGGVVFQDNANGTLRVQVAFDLRGCWPATAQQSADRFLEALRAWRDGSYNATSIEVQSASWSRSIDD